MKIQSLGDIHSVDELQRSFQIIILLILSLSIWTEWKCAARCQIYAILPDKLPAWQDCSTQGSHRKDVSFQRGDLDYIEFLQKANCITEHAGSSHHRNWMYVITFIFKLFFTKMLLKFASDAFYIGPIWTRQTPIFINNLSIISYGSRVHQFEPHPWHSMHGLILSSK